MQNLNILSEKSFFSAVFIYGYCFWGFFMIINKLLQQQNK